jgi:hypothetical protein
MITNGFETNRLATTAVLEQVGRYWEGVRQPSSVITCSRVFHRLPSGTAPRYVKASVAENLIIRSHDGIHTKKILARPLLFASAGRVKPCCSPKHPPELTSGVQRSTFTLRDRVPDWKIVTECDSACHGSKQ